MFLKILFSLLVGKISSKIPLIPHHPLAHEKVRISKNVPVKLNISHGRVHAYWTGDSVVSTLSIKSAITEDTGNYSCILPNTEEKVTASLLILKGDQNSFRPSINNMQ